MSAPKRMSTLLGNPKSKSASGKSMRCFHFLLIGMEHDGMSDVTLGKYYGFHGQAPSTTIGGRHFEIYSTVVRLHCSTTYMYATDFGSIMAVW